MKRTGFEPNLITNEQKRFDETQQVLQIGHMHQSEIIQRYKTTSNPLVIDIVAIKSHHDDGLSL